MIVALQTLIFFRESLLSALGRVLLPYFKSLSLALTRSRHVLEDEEGDDEVFAEYDEEKGVTFYPPMYSQRYAAVSDCLMDDRWCGKLEKVVDFGHHDMSFIKYLKEVPGIRYILGVDIETIPLRCSSDLLGADEFPKRESPLQVTLFEGNAADPDYRLIGCDAVIAIEMIEHMLPHDLERLVHTVFGFIKPWIVVFTTPNADFNVLFKALEKNGLRRWDHLFEWTREQFHDWCSNIVVRYPNYTVTCRGIGPGPPGTLHYGCCSQLALFIAKDYHKQADLNLNSLAVVAKVPSPNNFSEILEGWTSSTISPKRADSTADPTISNGLESFTELLYPEIQSHMTLVFSSTLCDIQRVSEPAFSMEDLTCRDQTLQCNLDIEIGKSFMMFNQEDYCNVLVPRRRVNHKVYEIEDVYSRLNCTTLQVRKFSKTTQNLMAKNRIDSLVHTREVVNEIRHLTKALNFNKFPQTGDGDHIWCNINWGDNAPYWNQYYKIVREYIYPFEKKSDEVRILDLILEEINRLVDTHYDDKFSVNVNRLEIPMSHLMEVVQHITDDEERVRDLLEWNGYEIVGDVVIHSRLVMDAISVGTHEDDWPDNDTVSDWGSIDGHSTSLSDASTMVPDLPGRCLRRALDQKVRNLRAMLSADEDITSELDKVVCRLMKLALQSCRARQSPPPTRWMQCKLLDLLTLTEKAIDRRRKNFIDLYPLKAIENKHQDVVVEQDSRINQIVEKYRHILQPLEKMTNTEDINDLEAEDEFLSTTSVEFPKGMKENEYIEEKNTILVPGPVISTELFECAESPDENPLDRTKAWLDEDIKVVPFPEQEIHYDNISFGDTDHRASNTRQKHKKSIKNEKINNKDVRDTDAILCKKSSITSYKLKNKRDNKKKASNTRIANKVTKNRHSNTIKISPSPVFDSYVVRPKRSVTQRESLNVTATKPIPDSLINLCHRELKMDKDSGGTINVVETTVAISNMPYDGSATKDNLFINVAMQDLEESLAVRKTVGTGSEEEVNRKDIINSCDNKFDKNLLLKHQVSTENVQAQTIFLNDINEPSTSKGIRHNVSTDVQCGTDTLATYLPTCVRAVSLSASTSLVKVAQVISTGIHDVRADTQTTATDFGTSTQDNNNYTTITPRLRSIGIKIKDSDVNICGQADSATMTFPECVTQTSITVTNSVTSRSVNSAVSPAHFETKLIKPISSSLKIEDSGSELCAPSVTSSSKIRSYFVNISKNTSDGLLGTSARKLEKSKNSTNARPRLCCGGIHVHSYRDKQVSEDVVYQGEWQRHRPKAFTRKKSYTFASFKKVNEAATKRLKEKKVNSKEKVSRKNQVKKQIKAEPEQPKQIINVKPHKQKQEDVTYSIKKPQISNATVKITSNIKRIPRPIKPVTKVASKIAMSAITSKNAKSTYTVKKPAISANVVAKKENEKPLKPIKSYIPLYLNRTLQSRKNKLNKSLDSASDAIKNSENINNEIAPLTRSKTEEIRRDLLKFTDEVRENISYVIFRNDLDDKIESHDEQSSDSSKGYNKSTSKQLDMPKRSHSPQSLNSSTCSSLNSVATVRAASTKTKNMSNKRHSASSYKNNLNNTESDSTSPNKTKKNFKRCKTTKTPESKDADNKENIPESTKNLVNKDKISKSFMGRPKSVCIAQIKTDSSPPQSTLSRQKTQLSNKTKMKRPLRKDSDEKRRSASLNISKKRSLKSDTSSHSGNQSQSESYGSMDSVNMVLVLAPQSNYGDFSGTQNISHISSAGSALTSDQNITDWLENSSLHSHASTILNAMRQILEEAIDRIVSQRGHIKRHLNSKSIILHSDDIVEDYLNRVTSSPINITSSSPIQMFNRSFLENNIENALNRSFESVLGDESTVSFDDSTLPVHDLDLVSFKSFTSVRKISQYYSADNEINSTYDFEQRPTQNTISVRDIFERKEPKLTQNTPGPLAIQAFSGFSLDVDTVAGDKPDSVALVDSETGSLAVEYNRQATSEELLVSGRSSDSYESCLLDEDTFVPNWLFQLISQQQSVDGEDEQPILLGPVPAPPDEPIYDANGNVIEPSVVGAGAGAGDGRGIHSDHSQDSSGRGTSISSSNTSSGPQSDVSTILTDASAFTAQFEMFRDPMASSTMGAINPQRSLDHTYIVDDDNGTLIGSHDDRRRALNGASDVDADISSTDTDVPDFSDN